MRDVIRSFVRSGWGRSPRGRVIVPASTLGLFVLATVFATATADAAALRFQVDQRGDFVLLGNTVSRDCGSGVPNPVVGTNGACGSNTTDTGTDVFWRADDPTTGAAAANNGVTVANARSTAVLILPAGATVTYARLYWSAPRNGATNDTTATIERPGGFALTTVNSDASVAVTSLNPVGTFYQSTANVTSLVQTNGAGAYRVGGIDTPTLVNLDSEIAYIGWSMVVFYRLDSDPPRNLALFDGLDLINSGGPAVTVTLSGFLVPNAGFDAKLGVVTYEGDDQYDGDSLSFNGVALSDARNPSNDFFNGTRSHLGVAVSNAGDLPQLTGNTRSMGGMDLDVVDVRTRLSQGATSATITASTNLDFYLLGAFVTSVSTFKPDFSGASKTVTNLTRGGSTTRPGDVIEYTITATNTGNDPATNIVLIDPLPAGVTFVPGSIRVVTGPNSGTKTNAADGDQAEYLGASRTVRARLGTGANGTTGGSLAIGASSTVAFQVTVDATATGTIANQATITATGQAGAPAADYVSDGNGPAPGAPPTSLPIDACVAHADCPGATPRCLTTPDPNVCVVCLVGSDCPGGTPVCDPGTHTCGTCTANAQCPGTAPVCQANGSCGQCSATNPGVCAGATPVCDVAAARCVECLASANCGAALPVCNPATKTCVGCLASTDCSGTTPVCSPATLTCRGCSGDGECGGATPACQATGRCGECSANNQTMCDGTKPICLAPLGVCGCTDTDGDAECGMAMSGLICSGAVGICVPGCGPPPGRNGCPAGQVCTAVTGGVGSCQSGTCASDADCTTPLSKCDTTVSPTRCVQCLNNLGCTAPLVCDVAGTKQCVECVSGQTANCSADMTGSRCLSNGTCGCASDSECGDAASGRICDANVTKCTPGCRGMGGNGCPTGSTCTSASSVPGSCVSSGSGGAGGGGGRGGSGGGGSGGGSGGASGGSGGGGSSGGGSGGSGNGGTTGIAGSGVGGGGGSGGRGGSSDGGTGAAGGTTDGGADARDGAAGSDVANQSDGNPAGATADGRPDGSADGAGTGGRAGDAGTQSEGGYVAGGGCACTTDTGTSGSRPLTGSAAVLMFALLAYARRRRR